MNRLERAIVYAVNAHSGAVKKGTDEPYIAHPLEVFAIVKQHTNEENVWIAALLHDVVEDTPCSIVDVEREFGKEVAQLVAFVTENKRENLPAEKTWKIRKQETLDKIADGTYNQQLLILADKLSNMQRIKDDSILQGEEFWNRFNQKDKNEHAWYYKAIAERLYKVHWTEIYQQYVKLVDTVFFPAPPKPTYPIAPSFIEEIKKHNAIYRKWRALAKKVSKEEQKEYIKNAITSFQYNGTEYQIAAADLCVGDYYYDQIEKVIEEDLISIGATKVFYHGMLD